MGTGRVRGSGIDRELPTPVKKKNKKNYLPRDGHTTVGSETLSRVSYILYLNTSVSRTMRSAIPGQRVFQECSRSVQCWLNSISSDNGIGPDGTESLTGVLTPCTVLAHLDLMDVDIEFLLVGLR
jgi:hypothetical protein